jgi:predicted  nucleic acid-binding Zn ribbon protein
MSEKIKKKIQKLEADFYMKRQELQDQCQHENLVKTYHSDTGAYSSQRYWTDFRCPDCGKFWVKEGSI